MFFRYFFSVLLKRTHPFVCTISKLANPFLAPILLEVFMHNFNNLSLACGAHNTIKIIHEIVMLYAYRRVVKVHSTGVDYS